MREIVSIIIPIYNSKETLSRCVDSILAQTYKKIEIILVDDGSSDGSFEISKKYAIKDNRVKIFHKENGGVSSARNLGLEKAQGEYVFFIDADDTIDYKLIESLINRAKKSNNNILIGSQANIVDGPHSEIFKREMIEKNHRLIVSRVLNGDLQGFIWGYLFKRKLCPKFEERIGYCEDMLFIIDYLKMNNISSITFLDTKESFYNYYQDTGGVTTTNKDIVKKVLDIDLSMQLLKERLDTTYYSAIDNKKDELIEAELQHANYADIKDVLTKIILPQYTGNKKNINVFCSLYRKKNVLMLRGYYVFRMCVKKVYLFTKKVFR